MCCRKLYNCCLVEESYSGYVTENAHGVLRNSVIERSHGEEEEGEEGEDEGEEGYMIAQAGLRLRVPCV